MAATAAVKLSPGLLNLTGTTASAQRAAENCLTQDHLKHHCYFRTQGLHNHLSHHILAAYDLGASAELLETIYSDEERIQRPIGLNIGGKNVVESVLELSVEMGGINEANWTKYLGDQTAYSAFNSFFTERILKEGVVKTIEEYIFSPKANEKGVDMLVRLMAGAVHPFIQLGYALEFGSDPYLVAEALAQAAVHTQGIGQAECYNFSDVTPTASKTPNLFQVIKEIYMNEILAPVLPYDGEALYNVRRDQHFGPGTKRSAELAWVCSLWDIDPNNLDEVLEQAIWAVTLLFSSTGRAGREPRLDFFLMHAVTSVLFLPSYFKVLPDPEHRVRLVRYWWATMAIIVILRGRPRIDGSLVMSYTDHPLPTGFANAAPTPSTSALGSVFSSINHWMLIINSALRAPDAHTSKTIRTLLYAAQKHGHTAAGKFPGALDEEGKEVLTGLKLVDGTVFVRTAGVVLKILGWVDWGDEEGDWDRSALGWDDAWKRDVDHRIRI